MSESTKHSSVPQSESEMVSSLHEHEAIKEYLIKHESSFSDLCELKEKGWASAEGDIYFQERSRKADNTGLKERQSFFRMTTRIGDEMDRRTNVFRLDQQVPLVLDLCMAPGGFTASVMKRFPNAHVDAITLSPRDGGYHVIAKYPNLRIIFADITLYATDFGVNEIPSHHPDIAIFSKDRPYSGCSYDLVFCGGAVLRTQARAEYRQTGESTRLTLSQLIFAFQRIKTGGTLVLLLHRVEAWDTICILRAFTKFANIKLFKPNQAHAIKSSFYLIAQSVQPQHREAVTAVEEWKNLWYKLTFGMGNESSSDHPGTGSEKATEVLEDFGTRLIELGRPIWTIQAEALRKSGFIKHLGNHDLDDKTRS